MEEAFESIFGEGVPLLVNCPKINISRGRLNEGTKERTNIEIEHRRVYKVARLSVEQRANMINVEQNKGLRFELWATIVV